MLQVLDGGGYFQRRLVKALIEELRRRLNQHTTVRCLRLGFGPASLVSSSNHFFRPLLFRLVSRENSTAASWQVAQSSCAAPRAAQLARFGNRMRLAHAAGKTDFKELQLGREVRVVFGGIHPEMHTYCQECSHCCSNGSEA